MGRGVQAATLRAEQRGACEDSRAGPQRAKGRGPAGSLPRCSRCLPRPPCHPAPLHAPQDIEFSDDGTLLSYSTSSGGSDWAKIEVR